VWRRQHTFNWDGKRIRQSERYHIVRVERFEPKMSDVTEGRTILLGGAAVAIGYFIGIMALFNPEFLSAVRRVFTG
jgi:hypothetical protein